MNRKKVNGSKATAEASNAYKGADACGESNSTDSFDMNDFKSLALTKKYSVQIHKNNADLMAELDNINIMGDESDVEMIEPNTVEQNGMNNVCDIQSSSKPISLNTTHTSDGNNPSSNGDFEHIKTERILAWAQSQSQNLSMCVASVLSDHDYLSQERLLGIIAGIEENVETSQREINSNQSKEESFENNTNNLCKINGGEHTENNDIASKNINDLSEILKKLADCKEDAQRVQLFEKMEKSVKDMKVQLTNGEKSPNENDSNSPEFASNHSEPLEYDGGIGFSAQSSVDESKDNKG